MTTKRFRVYGVVMATALAEAVDLGQDLDRSDMSDGDVSVIFIKDSRQDFSDSPPDYMAIETSVMLPSNEWAERLNMIAPTVEPHEYVITVHDART